MAITAIKINAQRLFPEFTPTEDFFIPTQVNLFVGYFFKHGETFGGYILWCLLCTYVAYAEGIEDK